MWSDNPFLITRKKSLHCTRSADHSLPKKQKRKVFIPNATHYIKHTKIRILSDPQVPWASFHTFSPSTFLLFLISESEASLVEKTNIKSDMKSLRKTKLTDCIFLSCHARVSDWIHTLWLPECQGTLCSKQSRNLKFKWLQLDSNPRTLNS